MLELDGGSMRQRDTMLVDGAESYSETLGRHYLVFVNSNSSAGSAALVKLCALINAILVTKRISQDSSDVTLLLTGQL